VINVEKVKKMLETAIHGFENLDNAILEFEKLEIETSELVNIKRSLFDALIEKIEEKLSENNES
jgi:hypothetical protein